MQGAEVLLVPRWFPEDGEYVRTGDAVAWLVAREFDREHLALSYGRSQATSITGVYDTEDEPRLTDVRVRGRVTRIFSVSCEMRADAARPGWLEPVPESATYEEREAMQPRDEFDVSDSRGWAGYLVELEPESDDQR